MSNIHHNDRQEAQMKTRKEAEARAMELYPDNSIPNSTTVYQSDIENEQKREAYLQCWDEMQAAGQPREAAERIAELETLCAEAMGEMPKEWRDRFRNLLIPKAPNPAKQ